jgi:hypothetical protein
VSADDRATPSLPIAPPLAQIDPYIGGTNKLAILSLISGVAAILLIGVPTSIIFGHIALVQIRRYGQEGAGLAITGLVLGYTTLTLWVVLFFALRSTPG